MIFLQRDSRPDGRGTKCRVKLWLAFYGHALLGALWGVHCTEKLLSFEVEPVQYWESIFTHRDLRMNLSVYVGGRKVGGPAANLERAWPLIHSVVAMDDPTAWGGSICVSATERFTPFLRRWSGLRFETPRCSLRHLAPRT